MFWHILGYPRAVQDCVWNKNIYMYVRNFGRVGQIRDLVPTLPPPPSPYK